MNYDLAMMALDGLTRAQLTVRVEAGRVTISGNASAFKEFARLCLLLGGASTSDESFELQPSVHVGKGSPGLKLELS